MAIVNYKCNDGTSESRDTDSQGRQDVPCRRNGGVDTKGYDNKTVIDPKQQEAQENAIQKLFSRTLADGMGIDTRAKIDPRESEGFSEKAKEQALLKAQQDYRESQRNVSDSFLEKHKNHLLIALALVAGYFAYKKFKK